MDSQFGAVFDGATLSIALYGVTCGQTIRYYRCYPNDSMMLKCTVGFVWVLDTFQHCLIAHSLWHYLIELRSQISSPAFQVANWSIIALVIPTEIAAALVEFFFIFRIWILSGRNKWTFVFAFPVSTSFLFSIGYVIKCFMLPVFSDAARYTWLLAVFATSRTITDVAIAASMCYILYTNYENDFTPRTTSLIKILVHYTVTTGLLTCIITIVYLSVYLSMPLNMIYIGVYFVHATIYVNSMLAVVNTRQSLRSIANQEISLREVVSEMHPL